MKRTLIINTIIIFLVTMLCSNLLAQEETEDTEPTATSAEGEEPDTGETDTSGEAKTDEGEPPV